MTYNVFGGSLNLTQSFTQSQRLSFVQVFIGVLSRVFLACRDRQSSLYGPSSPAGGGGSVVLKQSPDDGQSTDTPSGESLANQREWSILVTVLDRVCFTLSLTAVVVALLSFFPR